MSKSSSKALPNSSPHSEAAESTEHTHAQRAEPRHKSFGANTRRNGVSIMVLLGRAAHDEITPVHPCVAGSFLPVARPIQARRASECMHFPHCDGMHSLARRACIGMFSSADRRR